MDCVWDLVWGGMVSKGLGGLVKMGGLAECEGIGFLKKVLAEEELDVEDSYILASENAFLTELGWNILTIICTS